jgi:hypothetical protein
MLTFLRNKVSDRKLRLFGCACLRSVWSHLVDPHSRAAVELAERHADGEATEEQLNSGKEAAFQAAVGKRTWAAWSARYVMGESFLEPIRCANRNTRLVLLRDLFGNPFRSLSVAPTFSAWNDGAIPKIARSIYDGGAFDRLPILADALEEASCTDADLLDHCRGPGPHVRGCWVIDLLLGKE